MDYITSSESSTWLFKVRQKVEETDKKQAKSESSAWKGKEVRRSRLLHALHFISQLIRFLMHTNRHVVVIYTTPGKVQSPNSTSSIETFKLVSEGMSYHSLKRHVSSNTDTSTGMSSGRTALSLLFCLTDPWHFLINRCCTLHLSFSFFVIHQFSKVRFPSCSYTVLICTHIYVLHHHQSGTKVSVASWLMDIYTSGLFLPHVAQYKRLEKLFCLVKYFLLFDKLKFKRYYLLDSLNCDSSLLQKCHSKCCWTTIYQLAGPAFC